MAVFLTAPASALAQISVPTMYWSTIPADIVNHNIVESTVRAAEQNAKQAQRGKSEESKSGVASRLSGAVPATTIAPSSGRPIAPAKLAAAYPPANRAQAQQAFSEALNGYHQIESRFGIQRNDLAGATAALIAGSYMAYRDVDFPDENFKPLVEQLRQAMVSQPGLAQVSAQEKQETYEQLAILGTSMALTREALKSQPNPKVQADMRRAAKGYLESLLKTDADKVRLTDQGLAMQ